jgi:hypothetical protein
MYLCSDRVEGLSQLWMLIKLLFDPFFTAVEGSSASCSCAGLASIIDRISHSVVKYHMYSVSVSAISGLSKYCQFKVKVLDIGMETVDKCILVTYWYSLDALNYAH